MLKALKQRTIDRLESLLQKRGKVILPREQVYEWQINKTVAPVYNQDRLPDEAREYLVPNNPRLAELKNRYKAFDRGVTTPLVWINGHVRSIDLAYFRADNAYVWQLMDDNCNVMGYALATYYIKSIDSYNLLDQLDEDNLFGNITFNIGGKVVSRDLLDSIIELDFLDRHLGLMSRRDLNILDIGAGYGRLAHRASASIPGLIEYLCVDAVPHSTFISEFYVRYRNVERVCVVALDEIEQILTTKRIDIAVNVHSFSECQVEAIEWWVGRLAKAGVTYLFIVPNMLISNGALLQTNSREDLLPILHKHGYRPLACEPKYRDPVIQRYAMSPAYHFLFELG
jgi:hypothetical protein